MNRGILPIYIRTCLLVLAVAAWPAASAAEILEQILVKVNGDIITKTEFEARQVATLRQTDPQAANLSGDALKTAIERITPQLIAEAVDELLLLQRGRELGFRMNDQQFQAIVEQIRKENRLESDEAFHAALQQEGLTMTELRQMLERQMIVSNVQRQEVMGKMAMSEEEARRYHAENIQEFTRSGTVTLREILVAVPTSAQGVNVAADEAARERAEELRRRIMDGEAFGRLAAEVSDAPSRANEGLIGPLVRTELTPTLQQMLAGMKPGDVSPVMRTPRGYALFMFESEVEPEVLSLEESRDLITERLWEQKRLAELERYLTRLRSQATIEWKNEELRKAYETAITGGGAVSEASAPPS